MRRGVALGAGVCLALGLLAAGARADSDVYQNAREASKKSKWSWWPFGKKGTPAKKASATKDKAVAEKDQAPKPAARPIVQQQGTTDPGFAAREQSNVLRRQQVCDRLRALARELNDPQLDAQAQLLEQRSWFIYEQRTARPGMSGLIPLDESAAASRLLRDTEPRTVNAAGAAASLDRPIRSVTANSSSSKDRRED